MLDRERNTPFIKKRRKRANTHPQEKKFSAALVYVPDKRSEKRKAIPPERVRATRRARRLIKLIIEKRLTKLTKEKNNDAYKKHSK
jgi:hypothetical protein